VGLASVLRLGDDLVDPEPVDRDDERGVDDARSGAREQGIRHHGGGRSDAGERDGARGDAEEGEGADPVVRGGQFRRDELARGDAEGTQAPGDGGHRAVELGKGPGTVGADERGSIGVRDGVVVEVLHG